MLRKPPLLPNIRTRLPGVQSTSTPIHHLDRGRHMLSGAVAEQINRQRGAKRKDPFV